MYHPFPGSQTLTLSGIHGAIKSLWLLKNSTRGQVASTTSSSISSGMSSHIVDITVMEYVEGSFGQLSIDLGYLLHIIGYFSSGYGLAVYYQVGVQ